MAAPTAADSPALAHMEWIERHLMPIITVVWIAGIFWLRQRRVFGPPTDPEDDDAKEPVLARVAPDTKPDHRGGA